MKFCGFFQLMKLQARFRNDQRFKLDKRFLESDSDAESQGECFILKIFNCLKTDISDSGQATCRFQIC